MSGESWVWVGLAAFLILCCGLPILFMSRWGRGDMNDRNGRNHFQRKP